MAKEQQPQILLLPEGYNRLIGRDAQRANIIAARTVAETVRTTLGPKGMDKMLVDSIGDIVITNDGVTILEEMEIDNPAAKMIVEIAKTQEQEVGDGTTTAVVIAGELLKKAEELLDQRIHASVITKGYSLASKRAIELLNDITEKVDLSDKKMLEKIALTAMTGKSAGTDKETLASLVVSAFLNIIEKSGNRVYIDTENIKIEKKTGGGVDNSELISGIIIEKERVHSNMPKEIKNAKILLFSGALEVRETERSTEIRVNTPDQLKAFIDEEEKYLREAVNKVKASGASVVFCQKGIDDIAQYLLGKAGIIAIRRVKKSDMEKLAKATGAEIIGNLEDLTKNVLGFAGLVYEEKIAGEEMIFVRECKNPKAVTLLIRGGTAHIVDEIERAVVDAIGDLKAVADVGTIVYGGGSPEVHVSKGLKHYSSTLKGREQLAVLKFAEALETIPKTLAENAGLDPIDMLVQLKAEHDKNNNYHGVDAVSGKARDMRVLGVVEPSKVKSQAFKSAAEVAVMILRIDDVIAAGKLDKMGGMPPMPPGGMPEM